MNALRDCMAAALRHPPSQPPTTECQQNIAQALIFKRLRRTYEKKGFAGIRQDAKLLRFATEEFRCDPSCFAFKLWLAA